MSTPVSKSGFHFSDIICKKHVHFSLGLKFNLKKHIHKQFTIYGTLFKYLMPIEHAYMQITCLDFRFTA